MNRADLIPGLVCAIVAALLVAAMSPIDGQACGIAFVVVFRGASRRRRCEMRPLVAPDPRTLWNGWTKVQQGQLSMLAEGG